MFAHSTNKCKFYHIAKTLLGVFQPNDFGYAEIVAWFKTMTTNEYIKNVKQNIYRHLIKNYGKTVFMNMLSAMNMIMSKLRNI